MIFTKQEIKELCVKSCKNTLYDWSSFYSSIIEIMKWEDDEPRDITNQDIDDLTDLVAYDADVVLSHIEKAISGVSIKN